MCTVVFPEFRFRKFRSDITLPILLSYFQVLIALSLIRNTTPTLKFWLNRSFCLQIESMRTLFEIPSSYLHLERIVPEL